MHPIRERKQDEKTQSEKTTTTVPHSLTRLRGPSLLLSTLSDLWCFLRVSSRDVSLDAASFLVVRHVSDVDGDFFAEILCDFFQGQAGCFGEEEVDHLLVEVLVVWVKRD